MLTRDLLFVEDIAESLLLAAKNLNPPRYVNLGSGVEVSIKRIVELIAKYSGFDGEIMYDKSKSGGDVRRFCDVRKARELLNFSPKIYIEEGLKRTVEWYQIQIKYIS